MTTQRKLFNISAEDDIRLELVGMIDNNRNILGRMSIVSMAGKKEITIKVKLRSKIVIRHEMFHVYCELSSKKYASYTEELLARLYSITGYYN